MLGADFGFWGCDRPKTAKNNSHSPLWDRRSIIAFDETYRGLAEEKFNLGKNTATGK